MLYIRPDTAQRCRPDLHGLAAMLLSELSPAELAQMEDCLATGFRGQAKDLAEERGYPRSVVSCLFWSL